jgi:hypothetical protein
MVAHRVVEDEDHDRSGRSTAEHKAGARHLTTRFILGSALPSLSLSLSTSSALFLSYTHALPVAG